MNIFEKTIENILQNPRAGASSIEAISDTEMPAFLGFCAAKNLPLEVWNSIAVKLPI